MFLERTWREFVVNYFGSAPRVLLEFAVFCAFLGAMLAALGLFGGCGHPPDGDCPDGQCPMQQEDCG